MSDPQNIRPSLNRVHGVVNIMRRRAIAAAAEADKHPKDSQFAASLRGKATAYREAEELLLRLENGALLRGRRGWTGDRRRKDAS